MLLSLFLTCFPPLVFGFLFAKNYHREPRQFRNAIYCLLLCLFACWGLSVQFNLPGVFVLGILAVPLGTVALVVFLTANAIVVLKREGFSLSHVLPGLVALAIVLVCIGGPALLFVPTPPVVLALYLLVLMEGPYAAFTFFALLLCSWLYRRLPKRRAVRPGAPFARGRPRCEKIKPRGVLITLTGEVVKTIIEYLSMLGVYRLERGVPAP